MSKMGSLLVGRRQLLGAFDNAPSKIEKKVFVLPECTMARNRPLLMKVLADNGDVDDRMKCLFVGNCRFKWRVNVEALLSDEDDVKCCV
ncbi:hypothetical protein CDAR_179121 [Caerostris darwini]|uniref:Uncharacterized protein n=1 Tax=Caerostris darwini TaxID=1538125 RepID=A0AAV4PCJ3_9ARAC|nr:hypothetical protein CDAR_179121 [Caerostris darwini]